MQDLLIDAGNTRLKLGLFHSKELVFKETMAYAEVAVRLPELLQMHQVKNIFICDVSGKLEALLPALNLELPITFLTEQTILPFDNLYQSATLGSDRKALVAGAMAIYPQRNCLVIDAGTCVTYDILTHAHEFLGGNITPGLQMRLQAMHTFTGKLPLLEWQETAELMGNTTQACMQSGTYYGLIGEINYFVEAYQQMHPGLRVILTGGDAHVLAKSIKTSIFVNEDLLLHGLNKIVNHHAE